MPCTSSAAAPPIPQGRSPARSVLSPASANDGSRRSSSGRPARSWRSSRRNRCAVMRRRHCCSTVGRSTPTRRTRPVGVRSTSPWRAEPNGWVPCFRVRIRSMNSRWRPAGWTSSRHCAKEIGKRWKPCCRQGSISMRSATTVR